MRKSRVEIVRKWKIDKADSKPLTCYPCLQIAKSQSGKEIRLTLGGKGWLTKASIFANGRLGRESLTFVREKT